MNDDGQVELLTLTRLWLFPRYLYRVLDKPLGSPWNLRLIGLVLLFGPGPWIVLLWLGIRPTSIAGAGTAAYLLVPGLAVWWALTRLASGAKLLEVARSQAGLWWALRRGPAELAPSIVASRGAGPWL